MGYEKTRSGFCPARVANSSMMPLCQCFARRVKLYFDFCELKPTETFGKPFPIRLPTSPDVSTNEPSLPALSRSGGSTNDTEHDSENIARLAPPEAAYRQG